MTTEIMFWLVLGMQTLIFLGTMLLLNRFVKYMEERADGSYATMFRLVQQIREDLSKLHPEVDPSSTIFYNPGPKDVTDEE